MQASAIEAGSLADAEVEEPVRVWIETGDGSIARGVADVLSEDGAVVCLDGPASAVPGDEVAVRIAFSRTSPTVAAAARVLWIRSASEEPQCELEWTHSGPERERLASFLASLS
jgi:hypothetical protein